MNPKNGHSFEPREGSSLYDAKQGEQNDNQYQRPQSTARRITPPCTVRPHGQRAEQQKNQNNKKDCPKHCLFLHQIENLNATREKMAQGTGLAVGNY